MSEIEVIREAIQQNRVAQTALYQQYKTVWFMICLRYNRNRYDAEDCLQSAMVNIFSNLAQFDPEKGSFKSWSSRIIVNTNIQFLKRQQLFQYGDLEDDYMGNYESEEDTIYPISSEKMVKLVQQLPAGYRSIFNLYVMEGYNHREIAEIMNISIGTSKSQLAKAKKMLRKQLELALKTA